MNASTRAWNVIGTWYVLAVCLPYILRSGSPILFFSCSYSRAVGALSARRQDAPTQPAGGESAAFSTALLVRLPPERLSPLSPLSVSLFPSVY